MAAQCRFSVFFKPGNNLRNSAHTPALCATSSSSAARRASNSSLESSERSRESRGGRKSPLYGRSCSFSRDSIWAFALSYASPPTEHPGWVAECVDLTCFVGLVLFDVPVGDKRCLDKR